MVLTIIAISLLLVKLVIPLIEDTNADYCSSLSEKQKVEAESTKTS